jgi:hypothetical protein
MSRPDPRPPPEDAEALLRSIQDRMARGQWLTQETKRTVAQLEKTMRQSDQLLRHVREARGAQAVTARERGRLVPPGVSMRTILLPSGNLLVPVEPDDPGDGFGLREVGPEHPDYGRYLAFAAPGEDPRPREERTQ